MGQVIITVEDLLNGLYPDRDKLVVDGTDITAYIVDVELDRVDLNFRHTGFVELDCTGINYLTLSLENLETLKGLICQADRTFQKIEEEE